LDVVQESCKPITWTGQIVLEGYTPTFRVKSLTLKWQTSLPWRPTNDDCSVSISEYYTSIITPIVSHRSYTFHQHLTAAEALATHTYIGKLGN